MKKILGIGVIIIISTLLAIGIVKLLDEKRGLEQELEKLIATTGLLKDENASLSESIEYFTRPENMLKELKSQFNYKQVGEELIIVIPSGTSSIGSYY